jgi:hypothetical protein
MSENDLLEQIKSYISKEVFDQHKSNVLKKHCKLSSYNINPIVVKYLSRVLVEEFTPLGIAKALYYPRVLGTSINTTFGNKIQKMFVEIGLANGSPISGIDIEYTDKRDNRHKWCQLKSGPNTINSGDVKPILEKFKKVISLERTTGTLVNNNDLTLGILYGVQEELNGHYHRIDNEHPVVIGEDFWLSITGYPGFYSRLKVELDGLIIEWESENFFEEGLNQLVNEIAGSNLFDFHE